MHPFDNIHQIWNLRKISPEEMKECPYWQEHVLSGPYYAAQGIFYRLCIKIEASGFYEDLIGTREWDSCPPWPYWEIHLGDGEWERDIVPRIIDGPYEPLFDMDFDRDDIEIAEIIMAELEERNG